MTDYQIEMRIVVDDETTDLAEAKQRLAQCVEDMDPRPKFKTIVHWLVVSTEQLQRQNGHQQQSRGASDWMPQGHTKRRLGRGPQT